MSADEIRNTFCWNRLAEHGPDSFYGRVAAVEATGEVAAQLAELNEKLDRLIAALEGK